MMIDPLYSLSGFGVGVLVGMTGVGGRSLMTPLQMVPVSSVGAGAIGACTLIILYPRLPMVSIVGSDIAHAVPLTLIAGAGHWMIGTVDWHIMGSLLVESLPGVILGSCIAVRVAEPALLLLLAATLIVVAGKLLYDHGQGSPPMLTAVVRQTPH